MTSVIRVLSDVTINQIAAGEVIENPASVVKELVENSIDAGATDISVECIGGGLQLLKIIDNGCGMSHDDVILCIERHATSKIKEIDDLEKVLSMGFRGEALSSIASISKLTIHTSQKESGTKLVCHGGKIIHVDKAPRRKGTTIEVASLFYNVPARKKFQKTAVAAQMEITKMMTHLALGFPHISFKLMANGKEIFATRAKGEGLLLHLKSVMVPLLGEDFLNQTLEVVYEKHGIKITGFVGLPSYAKRNKSYQYLYINNRYVQSAIVSNAALEAYAFALDARLFPAFLFHVSIPPNVVDVNVHPQKRQVRFHDELFIHSSIKEAVQQAFGSKVREPVFNRVEPIKESFSMSSSRSAPIHYNISQNLKREETVQSIGLQPNFFSLQQDFSFLFVNEGIAWMAPDEFINIASGRFVMENDTGVVLIDLKELQKTILYHESYRKIEQRQRLQDIQQLIFPIKVDLTQEKTDQLFLHEKMLELIGVKIGKNKKNELEIVGLSETLTTNRIEEYLEEIAEIFSGNHDLFAKQFIEKLCLAFIQYACYRNIKQDEAKVLLKRFFEKKHANFSPFKKPIFIHVDENGLDRLFLSHQKSIQPGTAREIGPSLD